MPEFNAFKDEEVKDLEAQNHHGALTEPENKDAETRREDPAIPPQSAESPAHIEAQRENSTVSQSFGESEPLPPLHTPHRRRQTIMWVGLILITLDLCCLPITYYYALNFGTSLPLQEIFAVITSVYGMISFAHYGLRSLKLFRAKTAPRWRPVGWSRWGMLEFFHINFLIAISIVELELIIGTIPHDPWVRLCAMCSPTICYWFGFVFVASAILTHMKRPLPFNMSSTEKGKPWRPALLAIIEDAGGIEGQGGVVYRSNVMKRYEVSPIFRRMLLILTWFWGVGLMELRKEKRHWETKSAGLGQAVAPYA
ncbi:metal ion binding protein [Rutstroemia sp. NJR-2017a BBW]|nr:metal ion binding protein [Rutstroemia sp. NJR-2017a BBW]